MKLLSTLLLAFLAFFEATSQETYCINTTKLNLRDAPSSSGSNVLGQFSQGKQVIVFELVGDWAKVLVDGQNGYMWKDYLTQCQETRNPILGGNSYNHNGSGNNNQTNTTPTNNSNSNYSDDIVIICNSPNAYAYHKYVCRGLSRCSYGTSNISRKKAESLGRTPCQNCY